MMVTRVRGGELYIEEVADKTESFELTERELEVLVRLSDGTPAKVVAFELDLPFDTVRSRMKRIYRKLGVQNQTQAAIAAYRLGLVSFDDKQEVEA